MQTRSHEELLVWVLYGMGILFTVVLFLFLEFMVREPTEARPIPTVPPTQLVASPTVLLLFMAFRQHLLQHPHLLRHLRQHPHSHRHRHLHRNILRHPLLAHRLHRRHHPHLHRHPNHSTPDLNIHIVRLHLA